MKIAELTSENEKRYTGLLAELSEQVESEQFAKAHKAKATDFTRNRCLTFVTVVLFLLNMIKRSLQDELDEMYRALRGGKVAVRQVSKSAFSQARKKLKPTAFIELNRTQTAHFYREFEPETWFGYRLKAIDGSLIDVPNTPANQEHFGSWGSRHQTQRAKGRASQLFDVLNDVTVDALLKPKAIGERELAKAHIAHLETGDLLLLDRGYPAFWLFALIIAQEAAFCARLSLSWATAKRFVASGKQEAILTISPTKEMTKACRQHGVCAKPLRLRFLRIELDSGEIEVLVTSLLDSNQFPHNLFKELYHQRWPVEEDYKRLKSRLELENWSGKTHLAVYQDFHAAIFTKNLAAILAHPAKLPIFEQTKHRKHSYQVNMTNLISKMKDTVVHLFRDNQLTPILHALWRQICQTIEPIRPGRSYPRKKQVQRPKYPVNYKSTR